MTTSVYANAYVHKCIHLNSRTYAHRHTDTNKHRQCHYKGLTEVSCATRSVLRDISMATSPILFFGSPPPFCGFILVPWRGLLTHKSVYLMLGIYLNLNTLWAIRNKSSLIYVCSGDSCKSLKTRHLFLLRCDLHFISLNTRQQSYTYELTNGGRRRDW